MLWEGITLQSLPIRVAEWGAAMVPVEGRKAWHGVPHDKVSAPLWTALGDCGRERLSVCVRVYQHLSCLLLRCAGCWLTALPRLLHISQLRANRECKQKPTHCFWRSNLPYYFLFLYKPSFSQSLVVAFSASHRLIIPHPAFHCETPLPPSIHLSWSGSGVNHTLTGCQQT